MIQKELLKEGKYKGISTSTGIDVHKEGDKIVLKQSKHGPQDAIIILTQEDLNDIIRFNRSGK